MGTRSNLLHTTGLPVVGTFVLAFGLAHLPIECSILLASFSAAGLVSLSDERRRAEIARIKEAMTLCGYTNKSAAAAANMHEANFSRMLSPEEPGKLDYWRLAMLGEEFQRTLALLALRDLDLPTFVRRAIQVGSAIKSIASKEMAS